MKDILIVGFKGQNNSSKILIDKICSDNKLYLDNDFKISEIQLSKRVKEKRPKEVIIFGSKPTVKKIYIELRSKRKTKVLETNYDSNRIIGLLNQNNYGTVLSFDAGNYLCNNIYFHAQQLLEQIPVIFIHLPTLKNIVNIDALAQVFSEYLNERYQLYD